MKMVMTSNNAELEIQKCMCAGKDHRAAATKKLQSIAGNDQLEFHVRATACAGAAELLIADEDLDAAKAATENMLMFTLTSEVRGIYFQLKGKIDTLQGNPASARNHFAAACKEFTCAGEHPRWCVCRLLLGALEEEQGDVEQALTIYDEVLRHAAPNDIAHLAKAAIIKIITLKGVSESKRIPLLKQGIQLLEEMETDDPDVENWITHAKAQLAWT